MTEQHPLTPPEQLLKTWRERLFYAEEDIIVLLTAAYQAGADHELEACVNYIDNKMSGNKAREFRAIRRPKPPSLKELALAALEDLNLSLDDGHNASTIRRALEQLDD